MWSHPLNTRESISLRAPAKINLRLEVLGRRHDDYHEIKTWIYPISLEDEILIERVDTPKISLSVSHPGLPRCEDNLAYRAAALFMKEVDISGGVAIEINKKIPIAAGLGGGSSDAAAVLKAMNILWRTNISPQGLIEMGAKIGADVPFFIIGKGALMEGRGEKIKMLLPPLNIWMILVNPGVPLSTKDVYQGGKWGLTKDLKNTRILLPPQGFEEMSDFLRNDLEGSAMERLPIIKLVKDRLYHIGARDVLMTGSGPTVFGLFSQYEHATQALKNLNLEMGWISCVVHTLSDS